MAGYLNPETNQTDPVDYKVNEANKTITIMTNHFSKNVVQVVKNVVKAGPFKVTRDHTRYARIVDINPYYRMMSSSQMQEVIGETFNNEMEPGDEAFDAAFSASNTWLGVAANSNTLVGAGYSSELLQSMTKGFNMIGVMAALVQAGVDFQKGDTQALYTNLLKNGVYNTVSLVGTNALQLAFVGVFAIDYSITAFAEEAWDGSNAKWNDVYGQCYKKHFKKSAQEWYKLFYWTWHDAAYAVTPQDMSQVKNKIDQLILKNVWAVWNELSPSQLAECVDDLGYTNLGGLNSDIKSTLALGKREELVRGKLNPVMLRLQRPVNYKMREDYRKELKLMQVTLNQNVSVNILESRLPGADPKYAGYRIRFAPLNENADKKMWTGTLHADGTQHISFTLLGHMQAGSPHRLELYEPEDDPDNDNPVKVADFVVSLPQVTIDLGDGTGSPSNIQRCPLTGKEESRTIVDRTTGMMYADLEGNEFYDVLSAIQSQYDYSEMNYFTCSYSYGNELYMTDYTEGGNLVLSEEWHGTNGGERSAKIKYKRDYANGMWQKFDWFWEDEGWDYRLIDSGTL